jgi:tungstate transport system substrate-binding protein
MSKKFLVLGLLMILMLSACNKKNTEQKELIILSTTSTENSGLFDYILPIFEKENNIKTKVVAVGTGKALQMGKDGEGDILIVHNKEKEIEFVKEGHGISRDDLMYNEFVLLGPESNFHSLNEAFTYIASNNKKFISRGDKSGTHSKELSIWKKLNIDCDKEWHISSGKGMGSTIQMANEMLAYTLSDKATYLSMKNTLDIGIVFDKDEALYNQYGVILINPNKNDKINHEEAKIFKEWLLSDWGQSLIAEFGVEEFGEALFSLNEQNGKK